MVNCMSTETPTKMGEVGRVGGMIRYRYVHKVDGDKLIYSTLLCHQIFGKAVKSTLHYRQRTVLVQSERGLISVCVCVCVNRCVHVCVSMHACACVHSHVHVSVFV